jgi:predicted membrane protein
MNKQGDVKKLALGLVVLTAGVLFLFNRLDMIPNEVAEHIFSWQMILIAIGIVSIAGHRNNLGGWIIMAVGGFFLLTDIFVMPTTFHDIFWPMLIIVIGLVILVKGRGKHSGFPVSRNDSAMDEGSSDDTSFEDVSVFGGNKKGYRIKNLRSGKVVAIFGGSELDLRECEIADEGAVIEMVTIFGGSTMIIPKDWKIKSDVMAVFGGFDEHSQQAVAENNEEKTVYVKGLAIFGGGEIKRY